MSPILRRHGTTIALTVLAAAAGVGILVVDRGSVTTAERAARRRNLLPAFREDEIAEIRITTFGRQATIARSAADPNGQRPWRIAIDEVAWPAEEAVVDQLVAALRDGVVDRWVKAGAESAGDPARTIAVQMGRQRYVVTLRGPAPTPSGAVYAEVMGGDEPMLAVITAQLAAVLGLDLDGYRQKALVPWGPAEIASITLEGEGGPRRLVRSAWPAPRGGSFRFDGSTPEGDVRASSAGLDRIWDGFGKLDAEVFLPDAEADAALARKVTLTLANKAGARFTLDAGGACPGHPDDVVAVRRGPDGRRVSACVPRGAVDELTVPAAELADRRVVGARAEEVVEVSIESGGAKIALARSGSRWHQQAPVDRTIEPDAGRAFLERVLDVSADKLVRGDAKALGLDPPRATLRITSLVPASSADGGDLERVEIIDVGAEQGGVVHARRREDGAVAALGPELADALVPGEVALRPRKIHEEPASRIRSLRIEAPGRAQKVARLADASWSLVEPKGAGLVPDVALLGELCDVIGGLTAERWVGAVKPEHALGEPRLVITAELDGDGGATQSIRVAIGAPAGTAGSFARADQDPTVFVASRRIEEAASRWLVERTSLVTEASQLSRVTLTAPGGKRAVFTASGGVLRAASADPVATARAAAVREALVDLVAEAAVSVGRPEKHEGLDRPSLEVTIELGKETLRLRFGAGDALRGTSVVYARKDGVDATFAIAQSKVRPLYEALGITR